MRHRQHVTVAEQTLSDPDRRLHPITTPETFAAAHHEALRAWACGRYPLEAATELLIRGCGGQFAETGPGGSITDRGRA